VKLDDNGNEERDGLPDLVFSVSVRFPKMDLTTVVKRMKSHNHERQKEMAITA
jgi:hypothetical protein